MAIESVCTGCGQKLSVADEHAGKKARCPACGQVYVVTLPIGGQPLGTPKPSGGAGAFGGTSNEASSGSDAFGLSGNDFASSSSDDLFAGAAASSTPESTTPSSNDQYWMKAADDQVYGPVDRAGLDRWFAEGRVADNYTIRQGESGTFLASSNFRPIPAGASNSNPFASAAAAATTHSQASVSYPKSDQSGLILAMGIMSFIVCGICGIIAWVMGSGALKDIQAGRMDPTNKGLVQVGYYLGMASVLLHIFCIGGYVILIAFFAIGSSM